MTFPKFCAIAACDPNGVIALEGRLPWHLPEDLEHFYRTTRNQIVIMGYRTYLSLPSSCFKDRVALVFTQNHRANLNEAIPVSSLDELTHLYGTHKEFFTMTSFVIGGSGIFDLFFTHGLIDTALITHIKKIYKGDTYFPLEQLHSWLCKTLLEKEEFTLIKYQRKV